MSSDHDDDVDAEKGGLLPSIPLNPPSNQRPKYLRAVSSSVDLTTKLAGGALTINICDYYTLHIYVHYWLWQIPLLITNIILFYIWFSTHQQNDPMIALNELAFFAIFPVFLSVLVRDRIFLWFIYWCVQHTWCCSRYGRYHFSRFVDCIGGLHAGCGVTTLIWNIVYSYDCFIRENNTFNMKTITAFGLPLLFTLICVSAAPCFRFYYHNSFEILHRYLNWTSLCVLVTHLCVVDTITFSAEYKFILHVICNIPSFFALLIIILTVYPWFFIHKIKGKNVEIIPAKTGKSTAFIFPIRSPMGAICKLSTNWMEFHVMGITPLPYDEDKGYHRSLVLIKSLGDWSSDLNERAKLQELDSASFWIHRIKPPNFSQGLFNWNRVFALATGIGIAPLIPYVVHPDHFDVEISLVWIARDHADNFPQFIIDILKPLPNVVLYDTTKMERPDLSLLTVTKAKEFDADAVFVVSNQKIAYDVANYVHKKGIPVFASNFDV